MFSFTPSKLKWLLLCFLAGIVTLSLLNQNANVKNREYKSNEVHRQNYKNQLRAESDYEDSDIGISVEGTSTFSENVESDVVSVPLQKYFVETAKCKIPYIDPFEPAAMAIFHPEKFEVCSNETALVTPVYDVIRKRYVLRIDENLATRLLNSSETEYNCHYQEIIRDKNHDSYDKKDRKYFSQNFEVPLHVQGLIVECHRLGNDSDILQSDAYILIQHKPPPLGVSLEPAKRKPSVLMFGIDSLSRINLRRTMPKVYSFLTGSGWYEMQGYNKIGDNTFPNLMAILTGYERHSALMNVCDWHNKGCLDKTPFVWKYFKNASYLTAYAEDETNIGTFNYLKPGFVDQPTDYYGRPNYKSFESGLKTWKCEGCSMKYCIGRRITSSYVYDMAKEFGRRYVDKQPIWGLFWSNSFSHDSFQMPSKMEDYVLQYLMDFEDDGVFEHSIMIFMSDHGSRYGKIMSLPSGFLEERLPTMFIYLPPWFRSQYPEYANALEVNMNRLSSNYDLHNTLKHIIELGSPDEPQLPQAHDCPKCQSLFKPLPELRVCEDAGIPEHYCTCVPYQRIKDDWADRIAPLVIKKINEYLGNRNISDICATLTLRYIHKTEIKVDLDDNFHDLNRIRDVAFYRTKFKVKQNSADFETTLVFNNKTETVEVDVPKISRTDSYEKVSRCVEDKTDKMYCICKSAITDQ
ncbi:hypothetical protein KR067_012756 [Drosophila pandora]|nr:hypothetical protein KR067_012756 [Drosophila pandora]